MKTQIKLAAAIMALTLVASGATNAALLDGNQDVNPSDGSPDFDTSVFISVVERSGTNQVIRNLLVDTGLLAQQVFDQTSWTTTTAQKSAILAFINNKGAQSTISFNVGGALTNQDFSVPTLDGLLTTGNAAGPGSNDFSSLHNGAINVVDFIGNANNGQFDANGILAANSATDPGFHGYGAWGNTIGGSLGSSNEVLFGNISQIIGWRANDNFEILRSTLMSVTSDPASGEISFSATVVPLPGAAWLIPPALGLLAPYLKRRKTAAA
jgi:hypothetical protein